MNAGESAMLVRRHFGVNAHFPNTMESVVRHACIVDFDERQRCRACAAMNERQVDTFTPQRRLKAPPQRIVEEVGGDRNFAPQAGEADSDIVRRAPCHGAKDYRLAFVHSSRAAEEVE